MDNPGPDSEEENQHKRHRPSGYTVEGGGGSDRHSPPFQPTDAQLPPRVQGRKRGRGGYNGVKYCSGADQHRP